MGAPLRECSACGHGISRYSAFCRNCGHPQCSAVAVWLMAIFLVIAVAVYIGVMVFCMFNVEKFRVYAPPVRQNGVEIPERLPQPEPEKAP